ncbi:MAG TPA: hypothetical protein VGL61_22585 [Kofleriaceae bacterium]|jgi:hypothetical protein
MKRSVSIVAIIAVALAGCSGLGTSNGTLVDAPAKADAPAGSNQGSATPPMITMESIGSTPTFAAYRAGSAAWTAATTSNGSTYEIQATADYVFVAVCASLDGSVDEIEVAATADDGQTNYFSCATDDSTGLGGPMVAVTGTMEQAGNVQMFATDQSTTAPWTFSVSVPAGITGDLFAIDSTSMAITRDLAIGSAATQSVGTIDLSTQGAALEPHAISISNAAADASPVTGVYFVTQNDFATVSTGSSSTSVVEAPSSLLTNADAEYVDVYETGSDSFQEYETNDPTLAQFALLPLLDGITFTGTQASWTTLPQASVIFHSLGYEISETTSDDATVQMSPSWIAATGATSVAFDDSAPNWQPAWSFWTSVAYEPSFSIEVDSQTEFATSGVYAPAASGFRAQHRHRALRDHLRR